MATQDWREQNFTPENYRDFTRIGGGLTIFVLSIFISRRLRSSIGNLRQCKV